MKTNNLDFLIKELMEEHPGIPDGETARELMESMFTVFRKHLISHRVLAIKGLGVLKVRVRKGKDEHLDGRTGQKYRTSERNVLGFRATKQMITLLNLYRKPNEKIN